MDTCIYGSNTYNPLVFDKQENVEQREVSPIILALQAHIQQYPSVVSPREVLEHNVHIYHEEPRLELADIALKQTAEGG
jgi:hypothetical protein